MTTYLLVYGVRRETGHHFYTGGYLLRNLVLVSALLIFLLAGVACSSEEEPQESGTPRAESQGQTDRSTTSATATTIGTTEQQMSDVEIGEEIDFDEFSVRIFKVRSEPTVEYISAPGAEPATRDNPAGEYVAIDYVAENTSDSLAFTRAEATLEDAQGDRYELAGSIEPPGGGINGMNLERSERSLYDVLRGSLRHHTRTPYALIVR